jgi:hypothetical protein
MLLARLTCSIVWFEPRDPARTGNKKPELEFGNVKGIDSWAPGTQMEIGFTYFHTLLVTKAWSKTQ